MAEVPARLVKAVECLDVQPGERILEIGGGTGVAAELILEAKAGELVGIDRSAKAVAAAVKRNARFGERARFLELSLQQAGSKRLGRFDKVLAVNVNDFWTKPARTELGIVADLLKPNGVLTLCYDPPDAGGADRLRKPLLAHLEDAGWRAEIGTVQIGQGKLLLVVTGAPRP